MFSNQSWLPGVCHAYRPGIALFKGATGQRETHINNISAGIVVMPFSRHGTFGPTWKKWAQWLVGNRHLLRDAHIDQVAFALTLEELQEDVWGLPSSSGECNSASI